MENLPLGWTEVSLADVAVWGSGGTPNRSRSEYYGGDIPWIKTGDLNDSVINESSEFITLEGLKNSSAKLFPKGCVVIAMYGATIGKTAILGIDATTNQACAVAMPTEATTNDFLHYYLKQQRQNFIDKGKGGAQPNISQTIIKGHPINLPPLAEQQRIVAKLDALFGHLEALRTRLDRIPQLLKNFRQQVLTQAVTGKLTEEWRKEIVLDLGFIETINLKHYQKLKPVQARGQKGFDENSVLYTLPESWHWVPQLKLTKDGSNSISAGPFGTIFKAKDFRSDGVPIIFLRHVKPEGFNQAKPTFMDENVWKKYHQEYSVTGGELLVTKLGDPPGDATIYPRNLGTAMVTPDVMKSDLDDSLIVVDYVKYFFNSNICKDLIAKISFGMTRLRIDLTMFKSFPIPVPTLDEQREIVSRVESLFSIADKIEAQYQSLKAKIDALPQAILAKAFKGELVPQDPNDEPASVLLERIKGEKTGAIKKGRKVVEVDTG